MTNKQIKIPPKKRLTIGHVSYQLPSLPPNADNVDNEVQSAPSSISNGDHITHSISSSNDSNDSDIVEVSSAVVIVTNFGVLWVPINMRFRRSDSGSDHFLFSLEFLVLTRQYETKRLPIRFRNGGARPVVITNVVMDGPSEYMSMDLVFNKSYFVFPLQTAEIGTVAMRAIPNMTRDGRPTKTNVPLNGILTVTVEEMKEDLVRDSDGTEQRTLIDDLRSFWRYRVGTASSTILSAAISGWILLGNLNYSFQQSLWYGCWFGNGFKLKLHNVPGTVLEPFVILKSERLHFGHH